MMGAAAQFALNATRQAAKVAPTERRERSTSCGDHGKPRRRWAFAGNVPLCMAAT